MEELVSSQGKLGDASINLELLSQVPSLSKEHFFTGVAAQGDAAQVLFLKENVPLSIPALAAVESEVKADLRADMQQKAFSSQVEKLALLMEQGLSEGKSFDDVAKEHKLMVERYNFTLAERPESLRPFIDLPMMLKGDFAYEFSSQESALFMWVRSKKMPTLSQSSSTVQKLLAELEAEAGSVDLHTYTSFRIAEGLWGDKDA
jgi:uncharacterized protein YoaH (UPF0181 family)